MKILIVAGGLSPEREVSLTTGSLVADALVGCGYEVCLCDLYTGEAVGGGTPYFSADPVPVYWVGRTIPNLDALKAKTGRGERRIGPGIAALCRAADVVFIGLHGDVGENGQLQAYLDMEGIPYTGSGYEGSLLAMDKDLSKHLLRAAGIHTPDWVRLTLQGPDGGAEEAAVLHAETAIGYPCVVKPCGCGSSVGVSMVANREELRIAIRKATAFATDILVEKKITGRELTISVLGKKVLPAVEIIPHTGFYDYENKYQAGATTELCPAPLTEVQADSLAKVTLHGFEVLRLDGYARFDYIMDDAGIPWCLEANTLPGMTPTSLLPQEAAAVGMEYPALCEYMVKLALEKGKKNS